MGREPKLRRSGSHPAPSQGSWSLVSYLWIEERELDTGGLN
jgi:hypothetical protein